MPFFSVWTVILKKSADVSDAFEETDGKMKL